MLLALLLGSNKQIMELDLSATVITTPSHNPLVL